MCKTTTQTQASANKKILNIPPNTVPFEPKFPLQKYLDKAYLDAVAAGKLGAQTQNDEIKKLHVPISLFALAKTGDNHKYAGIHDDEMHFSASLLKVAAMYAAFNLLAEAESLKRSLPPGGFSNQNDFFAALSQQFKTADAVRSIQDAGVGLNPRYMDILSVKGFGQNSQLTVSFVPSFYHSLEEDKNLYEDYKQVRKDEGLGVDRNGDPIENSKSKAALRRVSHMYLMIVLSNNRSAGECIRRLGYAYINVKLINGEFFDKETSKGIWLASDFGNEKKVFLDSVNNKGSSQATTSRQIARLFQLVQLGKLVDSTSSLEMQKLLQEANRVERSWLSRSPQQSRLFKVDSVKIGVSNLKPNTKPRGPNVYSEGIVIKWKGDIQKLEDLNLKGEIAVCWQNLRAKTIETRFEGISEVIEKAFSNFLNQTSI